MSHTTTNHKVSCDKTLEIYYCNYKYFDLRLMISVIIGALKNHAKFLPIEHTKSFTCSLFFSLENTYSKIRDSRENNFCTIHFVLVLSSSNWDKEKQLIFLFWSFRSVALITASQSSEVIRSDCSQFVWPLWPSAGDQPCWIFFKC